MATFCALLFCAASAPVRAQPARTPPQVPAVTATSSVASASRDPFTPHIPPRALDYQRAGRVVGLVGIGWQLLGLWLWLPSGLSVRLRDALNRRFATESRPNTPPFRALALFFAVFSLGMALWQLPIGLAFFALEHHFGFSNQSLGGFLTDKIQAVALQLPVILPLWSGYWLSARSPRRWWKWLWGVVALLLLGVLVLKPLLVDPLYYRYTPMKPGPLRDKILALADKAGIKANDVFVEDTSRRTNHVNAYVTGLGPTTRIVLNDTALRLLPEDQILAMMGHEMGHYVEGHIWFGFVGGTLGAGVFLWLAARGLPWLIARQRERWRVQSLNDLAALPLLFLFIALFLLLQSPVESAISRIMEHRADAFGLRVTGLNDATARLFVGFAERDYSDPDPPRLLHFWFGSHPTLSERIAFARHFRPD